MFVKICGMNSPEAVAAAVARRRRRDRLRVRGVAARSHAGAREGALRRPCRHTSCASPSCGIRTRSTGNACVEMFAADLAPNGRRRFPLDHAADELRVASRVSRRATRRPIRDLPDRLLYEGTQSGAGRVADWDEAHGLARVAEVILAGGLTADNVADAIRFVRPVGCRRLERRRARARREGPGQDQRVRRPRAGDRRGHGCPR